MALINGLKPYSAVVITDDYFRSSVVQSHFYSLSNCNQHVQKNSLQNLRWL